MNACQSSASLDPATFAMYLPAMRPRLVLLAMRVGQCSKEDAKDHVSDAVTTALMVLPKFVVDPQEPSSPYPASLLGWLRGVVRMTVLESRRKARRSPQTAPMDAALSMEAPACTTPDLCALVEPLPAEYRPLVRGWLEGRSQAELSREYALHRNTVANRLTLGFELLQRELPDSSELPYTTSFFDWCSHVPVYHAPTGMSSLWYRRRPPDVRLSGRR
jgi:DNA-directed RNA polymerase specialized sigma24 family protein